MTIFARPSPLARLAATLLLGVTLAGTALAQDDAVVATVNGQPVTERDLALASEDLNEQFAQLPPEQRRVAALTALIEIRLLAARAEEAGLAETPEFQQRMELLRQRSLHSAFIENEIAGNIDEAAQRARYDELLAEQPAQEEVRARHILVDTEEEAREIIGLLDAGGNFEEIAAERSSDGAAAQGGDLGYFTRGRMVPAFEEAAFAMETGSHSADPVQTQFGFHVIKVEDKRTQEPPSFEQVQPQIQSLMLREAYVETVDGLRDDATVEISDEALKQAYDAANAPAPEAPAAGETPAADAPAETEEAE